MWRVRGDLKEQEKCELEAIGEWKSRTLSSVPGLLRTVSVGWGA